MRVLITEDDGNKLEEIKNFLVSLDVAECEISTASNMVEFSASFDDSVNICIIDLRIPAYDGAQPDTNGIGVLQAIEKLGGGRVKLLAISSYPEEFSKIRSDFEARGCLLVSFNEKEVWQGALRLMVVQSKRAENFDFLIFSALRAERAPYTAMKELNGQAVFRENLTRYDISIGGRRGSIIELPRMGLVDAATVAAGCIERFKPKLVAMSGICAGFEDRADLGQLLISEIAYEYQSGKWTADGFSQEPYQVPITEEARSVIRELIEDSGILSRLEAGWNSQRPSKMSSPKLALFTSGSAVIASEKFMDQVSVHHRKVSGLDMEVYAVHRAAQISLCKPHVICAKTVVDLAGVAKDDELQPYGCSISAKFIVEAVAAFFAD